MWRGDQEAHVALHRADALYPYRSPADTVVDGARSEGQLTVLAIQEENVTFPVGRAALGARRVRVVRLEHRRSGCGTLAAARQDFAPANRQIEAAEASRSTPRQRRRVIADDEGNVYAVALTQPREDPPAMSRPAAAAPERRGYRALFDEPGLRVTVAFGQFRAELGGQLDLPDRMRPEDDVECHLQVYEIEADMTASHLSAQALGQADAHVDLHPLTQGKAQRLGIADCFRSSQHPYETRASTRQLYRGQRLFRLRPALNAMAIETARRPQTNTQDHAKRQIPTAFNHPSLFRATREEVLYDMKSTLGTCRPDAGPVARWLMIVPLRVIATVLAMVTSIGQMRKWRAMLGSKSLDQQLWSVTPPRGFTRHPTVRSWAGKTLATAGYDAAVMLAEWEIFWRRRGLA
jgi:hypothetical protein